MIRIVRPINTVAAAGAWQGDGQPVSLKSRVIQQGYCEYWPPNNSSCGDSTAAIVWQPHGTGDRVQAVRPRDRLHSQHINPPGRPGNYCQLVSLCLLPPRCTRLPLLMSPTAFTATESCAEYRLHLRGNYRDKDMP